MKLDAALSSIMWYNAHKSHVENNAKYINDIAIP